MCVCVHVCFFGVGGYRVVSIGNLRCGSLVHKKPRDYSRGGVPLATQSPLISTVLYNLCWEFAFKRQSCAVVKNMGFGVRQFTSRLHYKLCDLE